MPKVSEEFLLARREEIIDACATLYQTMSFKDITIKEIGKVTSFNRTSIYNYFNTKEEIFLALMQREYMLWVEELKTLTETNETMSGEELADALALTLAKRERLLKLLSMNHFDMEENSSIENLTEFKKSYGATFDAVERCLKKFFPALTDKDRENFLYAFFPFVYGIYPYGAVTEKQSKAMKAAGLNFVPHSIYELAHNFILKLL